MRGGDRISFAAAGSSEFDRAVLRVGLAYALFGLTLGLEIQTTIKSPARAYVSADEALVDQARAPDVRWVKDAFQPRIPRHRQQGESAMPEFAALSGFIERNAALAGRD